MASSNSRIFILVSSIIIILILSTNFHHSLGHVTDDVEKMGTRRVLVGFKENPAGSNTTFQCSPSGPCVPCLYSEKNDEKYRCSETGYRIPLKCTELDSKSKDSNAAKAKTSRSLLEIESDHNKAIPHALQDLEEYATIKHRSLLDDSSKSKGQSQAYITYRSCIPPANEEKLSVLGFEGIVLCLLFISGSVIYIRRKQALAISSGGAVRIPTNSRF